jgi:flagellar biosynthesis protein FliQ
VQNWFEFGFAGTLVAALLLGLLFRAMTRLNDWQLSIATTTSLGVYTVALCQPWCLASLVDMPRRAGRIVRIR